MREERQFNMAPYYISISAMVVDTESEKTTAMSDYLDIQDEFTNEQFLNIDKIDEGYAEGIDCKGNRYSLCASLVSDFPLDYKIEFRLLKSGIIKTTLVLLNGDKYDIKETPEKVDSEISKSGDWIKLTLVRDDIRGKPKESWSRFMKSAIAYWY